MNAEFITGGLGLLLKVLTTWSTWCGLATAGLAWMCALPLYRYRAMARGNYYRPQ